ncbi:sigma factor, partial [Streptomyces sp. NPDC059956]|uniref:sigma factor n=1 Tax=Streptomyces sp. NPDC059956 TaxID=3347015 RepID=UPI003665D3AF
MPRSATVGPARANDTQAPTCDRPSTPIAPRPDLEPLRVENPREMAPTDARELSRHFFRRLQSLEEGTREYQYARNTLIEMNLSLVQFAARRFRNRVQSGGLDMDDIIQVGTIGLIKAIDRYDLE